MTEATNNEMASYRTPESLTATILLVEDEPAVRNVTREALEMGGYRVLAADGPVAATHIARNESNAIDLLLTDVIMPGMNGPELARLVRELRPELVTLFMTGYADAEVLRLAALEGAHTHIQKPFTIHSLLARVADALAARWNNNDRTQAPQYPPPSLSSAEAPASD
jgi:CheY-like chemotaxis protein